MAQNSDYEISIPFSGLPVNQSSDFSSDSGWSGQPEWAARLDGGKGVIVGPGADNKNVLAQQFSAFPHQWFRLVARASSVNAPCGSAKFQVNWLDAQGQFITTASCNFEVNACVDTYRFHVLTPPESVIGVLYVVPGNSTDVIRFMEMSAYRQDGAPFSGSRLSSMAEHGEIVSTSESRTGANFDQGTIDVRLNSEPFFARQGSWGSGYPLARRGEGGVCVGPGATNPNVIAQTFPINYPAYYLRARAASADGAITKALFQINWLSKGGDNIGISRKEFQVEGGEVSADCVFDAPPGAFNGVIYVAPGSEAGQVIYFEMSLWPSLPVITRWMAGMPHLTLPLCGPADDRDHKAHIVAKHEPVRSKHFWEAIREDRPLVFIHIPKCAGYSIYATLKANYRDEVSAMGQGGVEQNVTELFVRPSASGVRNTRLFAGHVPTGFHRYFGECNYLTVLRHPLKRVVSSFYFNADSIDAPTSVQEQRTNRTLLQFAEQYDNVMTRFLLTSSFSGATYWLSGEANPNIDQCSYLGLEFGQARIVRTIAVQQWNCSQNATRYLSSGGVGKVAIEYSHDGFATVAGMAGIIDLVDDHALHAYDVPNPAAAKYWRIRALTGTLTPRWGVVALKFFEADRRSIPLDSFDTWVLSGKPLASSHLTTYYPDYAFDGHDRPAMQQISPGFVTASHLDEAIGNLRDHFLFGLTDNLGVSIKLFGALLGWQDKSVFRLNTGTANREDIALPDGVRRNLEAINSFDMALYEYALKLFDSDLKYHQTLASP